MLQIIGWLGCLYLLIKGVEILSNSAYRTPEGWLKGSAVIAIALAFIGSIVFSIWLLVQGGEVSITRTNQPYGAGAAPPFELNSDEQNLIEADATGNSG
jgi:hypothetical protein